MKTFAEGKANIGRLTSLALVALLVCTFLSGCATFGYRDVSLEFSPVNEANEMLVVEGVTSLPDTAVVVVALSQRDVGSEGPIVLVRGRGSVQNGSFCTILDVSDVPGNEVLSLEVRSSPDLWPDQVKRVLGTSGEYMLGERVHFEDGANVVSRRMRVVLPMNRRDSAIRRLRGGDYALAISQLEGIVEANGKDREAAAWLALALLQRDQEERQPGSRAHSLLRGAHVASLNEPLQTECARWLVQLDEQETEAREREARLAALAKARQAREEAKTRIVAGQSMGGVKIGDDSRSVFALYPPRVYPKWDSEFVEYPVRELDMTVVFDGATRHVVCITTTSSRFSLSPGIFVGRSDIFLTDVFPDGTFELEPRVAVDAQLYCSEGDYSHPSGLVLGVKQYSTELGVVNTIVTSISVVAPYSVTAAASASPAPSENTPESATEASPSPSPSVDVSSSMSPAP